ncbi:MAG: TonB-dependent receptor, partial [Cyanobacteria bacterium J06642_9]
MRHFYRLARLGALGLTGIVAGQPAWAVTTSSSFEAVGLVDTERRDSHEWERPILPEVSQVPEADVVSPVEIVEITDVQITPTETGLTLILNTSGGAPLVISTAIAGNALVANLPNAVLNLPDGNDFQAANPAEGIAFITVTNLPDNEVQVAITGTDAPPVADVQATSSALVLSIATNDAAATDATSDNTEDSPLRIVVTAEKTPAEAGDVPISLTVLSEQDIEDADITTLEDIAQSTPNFSVFSGSGSRSFNYYSVRGLSNFNFSSRDAVGFFVDDVPYDYGGFITQDFLDLERVEVLRGPQSTLYGRSSQAGVVNIITRRPTNEFEFNGVAGYGAFNDLDLRASVSGPLVEDHLFYRFSGGYGSRDGYFTNTFLNDDLDDQSGGNGRGQLLWTPAENWEILFNASFDEYREGGAPLVLVDDNPFEVEQDVNGFGNLVTNAQSLRIAYDSPGLRATSITSRRFSRQAGEVDLDSSTLRTGQFSNIFDSTVITQELRLQSPTENPGPFQWLIGGYYESRSFNTAEDGFKFGEDASLLFGAIGVPGGSFLRSADVDETVWAGFGQISYQPIEPLTLTAGLRYESIRSTLDSFERVLAIPGAPPTTVLSFDDIVQSGDIVLPRFAIEYRFNPNLLAYSSVTRGYRPGGVNFRPNDAATLTFEPERSWNYEVGLKSSWFENRLGVNFAFFHNPVSDYQVQILDQNGLPETIINADAEITGFELELRATPLDGLDVIAGVGFIEGKLIAIKDCTCGRIAKVGEPPIDKANASNHI